MMGGDYTVVMSTAVQLVARVDAEVIAGSGRHSGLSGGVEGRW